VNSIECGDGISVDVLVDCIADHPRPLEECFLGSPTQGWASIKDADPQTVGAEGRWRLPIHAFLVRTPNLKVLIDAGVGCERTVAAKLFQAAGRLPDLLDECGECPEAVDIVAFTHLHADHVGWAADPDNGKPTFPKARYLVTRHAWEESHADDGRTPAVRQALDPIENGGKLELIEPGELAAGIEVVALPGHTPTHCGVVISGPQARVAIVGDAFNHRLQIAQPEIPSRADWDPAVAAETRRQILGRARSGEWSLLGSTHIPGAWWT